MRGSAGDVDAVAALLAEDAVFSMPPWASWWRGRDDDRRLCAGPPRRRARRRAPFRPARTGSSRRRQLRPASRNPGATSRPRSTCITFEGELIKEITAFVFPELFPRFDLPAELAPSAQQPIARPHRQVVVPPHAGADPGDVGPVDVDRDRGAVAGVADAVDVAGRCEPAHVARPCSRRFPPRRGTRSSRRA